ncbi:formin frm1 [Cyclospora cayetanensis]|uniref:Formin frm1 n=1 Tax=Cyclospora cayetanensis TaxID=88456 RepID=A0A1D3CSW4_9EIME|nr:formin frm1 [Cyclospora cayetanensis]
MLFFKDSDPQTLFKMLAGESTDKAASRMASRLSEGLDSGIAVHSIEPPPLPIQQGGDRNPSLLTSELRQVQLPNCSRSREMAQRVYEGTQTADERRLMLEGIYGREPRSLTAKAATEAQELMDAMNLLQRLSDFAALVHVTEVQAIRMQLRVSAVHAFQEARYSDAALQALYSYLLAKKYYIIRGKEPLQGEMVPELLVLAKCCGVVGSVGEGRVYLDELRLLVENSLKAREGQLQGKASAGKAAAASPASPTRSTVSFCFQHEASLCPRKTAEAPTRVDGAFETRTLNSRKDFFLNRKRYVGLSRLIYANDPLAVSDALSLAALHLFRSRSFAECVPILQEVLSLRIKELGDYDAPTPHPRVADVYANLGLVFRLLGRPADAFPNLIIALDMRMRIHQIRDCEPVQDLVLALGCVQHQGGRLREALDAYREVFAFRSKAFGVKHPDTVTVRQLLTLLEADLNKAVDRKDAKLLEEGKGLFPLWDAEATRRRELREMRELPAAFRHEFAPSLEAFKRKQSGKGFIYNKNVGPFRSVARTRALYGDEWRTLMVPSCAILPYLSVEISASLPVAGTVRTGPDTLELAAAYEFQDSISLDRPKLPIANVPAMQHGVVRLVDGQPQMQLNPEVGELLASWGLEAPVVTPDGDVVSTEKRLQSGVSVFIPLVDEKTGDPIIGFHGKPLMVPNPAVFHGVVLPELIKRETEKGKAPRIHPSLAKGKVQREDEGIRKSQGGKGR